MKFYIQQSALDRLKRIGHRMDATGKQTAQISVGPAKGFVEVVLSEVNDADPPLSSDLLEYWARSIRGQYAIAPEPADDGKCGDCPNGPVGGKRETYDVDCGECKRFYADLKVKP